MKRLFLSLMLVLMSLSFMAHEAQAKRFGGGGMSGMQRSLPARAPTQSPGYQAPPASPAAPTSPSAVPGAAAGATAAAAAPRRSWMGPIAGLAAGLGIAALFSHFGMGEGLANFMMMALLAVAAVFVIRLLMSKFGANRNGSMATMNNRTPGAMGFQGAGYAGSGNAPGNMARTDVPALAQTASPQPGYGNGNGNGNGSNGAAFGSGAAGAASGAGMGAGASASSASAQSFQIPAGFDVPAFERIAKMIFIRMQAANDVADLNDLRQFTTPELFASVRLDLQERGNTVQQTDVVKLDAEVLDIARENGNQVVSVRFHGLIREDIGGAAAPFDEVWHLVKPENGSHEWAIAGIAQYA